jgi:hypothetical protein
MNEHRMSPPETTVRLDLSRMSADHAATDTRYNVALEGTLEEEWVADFRSLLAELPSPRRYEFDRARSVVRFSCRTVEGTGVVFDALERLEAIVENVNRRVAARRLAGPRVRPAVAAPGAR